MELDVAGEARSVVLKRATAVEVAAMRAIAVVRELDGPRPLAIGTDWLVLPFVDAPALANCLAVPDAVWQTLARVHAHWLGRRPRGLPVVDAAWWAGLCDRTLVAVEGGAARSPDPAFTDAARALRAWRADPRIVAALALLARTLVHGDPHRGNILGDADSGVLIDWGNARVAAPGLDLAVLRAQGAPAPATYTELFAQLTGGASGLQAVEAAWADVHVHVQYLGFAADHLGPGRVAEMIAHAAGALGRLGVGLADLPAG
ncbi:phosphotransferase [Pseudonocardia sp. GCM10023141]|uniref:phosphotransferase n=1 Tax=Pseudonocardia sp. GCM10023141 TaxID=3252653 RepID=UPI00360F76D5